MFAPSPRVRPSVFTRSVDLFMVLILTLTAVILTYSPLIHNSMETPSNTTPLAGSDFGKLPLSFVPNNGQTDPSVQFQVSGMKGTLFFTSGAVVLSLPVQSPQATQTQEVDDDLISSNEKPTTSSLLATVVRLRFDDVNPSSSITGSDRLSGIVNYFVGNDSSKWRTNIPTYAGITYHQLYHGIDLHYNGKEGLLKGTYVIAAGKDPSRIRWHYDGATNIQIDTEGNLIATLPDAHKARVANTQKGLELIEHAPVAWQEIDGQRIAVEAHYSIAANGSIGFRLGDYDHTRPLTIDPTVTYGTYLGGSGAELALERMGIAVDIAGNTYVTAHTYSTNFPTTVGVLQPNYAGGSNADAFVTKLNVNGTGLVYSTYLGGTLGDRAFDIAVDIAGNAYITGITDSTNFPTLNPLQSANSACGTCSAGFVSKLNATGNSLLYSTYLSGTEGSYVYAIAVDNNGNAYVTGSTLSNFPTTTGAIQTSTQGFEDPFVTKLNPSAAGAASLIYSTYLGGSQTDRGYSIAVDNTGNAYVTGETYSNNFPIAGAIQSVYKLNGDAFIAKVNANGTGLLYSTYLGGSSGEMGSDIALDSFGNAYITGITGSTNFPITSGAYQQTKHASYDVYVTKINTSGSALSYSTYLGGSESQTAYSIAVDGPGNAYAFGTTESTDFPIVNPIQATCNGCTTGGSDAYLTKLDLTGSNLIYSTYLGGSSVDNGRAIAVDNASNAYIAGDTSGFPTTAGAYDTTFNGNGDIFAAKITTTCATPSGTTFYVSPTGSDCNPGTISQPFRTISKGMSVLTAGKTLFVRAGTYAERISLSPSQGTSTSPITVQNYSGERAVLQGKLWLTNANYWVVDGINVTWSDLNGDTEDLVKFSGGTGWKIQNAEIWGAKSYADLLVTGGATGWYIGYSTVHDNYSAVPLHNGNQDHLIYVSNASNGTIERNLLYNSPGGRGIKMGAEQTLNGPSNIKVRYNTIYNNLGPSNIQLSDGANNILMCRNILQKTKNSSTDNVTVGSTIGTGNVAKYNLGYEGVANRVVQPSSIQDTNNSYANPQLDSTFHPQNIAAQAYGRYAPVDTPNCGS